MIYQGFFDDLIYYRKGRVKDLKPDGPGYLACPDGTAKEG